MRASVFKHSRWRPGQGGHAPGEVRDAFGEAVDAYESWKHGEPHPAVAVRGQQLAVALVCGVVWNCSDVMPSLLRSQLEGLGLEFKDAVTYAVGARWLKATIMQSIAAA
jgi:hypothetical protein